ncbi:GPP34 family phosphoprotein [Streptomyces armeniacus]|uniref:GPP34 family phosphoprotein n=1 Tax=Streptomyces armeniacus TaxID=83291 RepID=A0A345XII0_9ACTN|nr:GPP34 family phosphoprotein [Streptomyces armeniacus]AXK31446.1 GPP34 family phosphoprotein [Streptomyces armeniacus]
MTRLTLPEELMLIALDDETGGGKLRPGVDYAVAGMALVELSLQGRVDVSEDDRVSVLDSNPVGVSYLDAELAKIVEKSEGSKVGTVLRRSHMSAINGAVDSLVERGVLEKKTKRVLGLLPISRYPEAEGAPELEIRKRIGDVVLEGGEPDERTAALIAVLHGAKLWGKAFPDADRKQVKKRMEEISEGSWVQGAVAHAVKRTRIAIAAAAAHGGG